MKVPIMEVGILVHHTQETIIQVRQEVTLRTVVVVVALLLHEAVSLLVEVVVHVAPLVAVVVAIHVLVEVLIADNTIIFPL